MVTSLELTTEGEEPDTYVTLKNGDILAGQAGFRFTDDEVTEVFYLRSAPIEDYEVSPGVHVTLNGWGGGNVIDFEFGDMGALIGGKIVVGPFPDTDPNDVVVMEDSEFTGLEFRVPGPALRFTPGANARVYVMPAEGEDVAVHFGFITPHDQDGSFDSSQPRLGMGGETYVYEFTVPEYGTQVYRDMPYANEMTLAGPAVVGSWWDYDREYALFASDYDWLNGNSFPGTAQRLSGWYLDTMRIKQSKVDEATGDTIVEIVDEARITPEQSLDDPYHPPLASPCPAHGGPIIGRYGTGCVDALGNHVNRGHNIVAETWSPGVRVWIENHRDSAGSSINGVQIVRKETQNTFRIQKVGENGSGGGVGGVVHIWRLHKSSVEYPELQNNGASGGYLRFNYEETILLHFFNGDSTTHHLHIHGHNFNVIAANGYELGASRMESSLSVPPLNAYSVVVEANNPNRVGTWMLSADIQHFERRPLQTVWPLADFTSRGIAGFVDYTGEAQGRLAINADGEVVPYSWMPPLCSVGDEITVLRDSLGFAFPTSGEVFVLLSGEAAFPSNLITEEAFGTVNEDGYSWELVDGPAGGSVYIEYPDQATSYVYGFTMDGTYTFAFKATGHNDEEDDDATDVECVAWQTVTVCADASACGAVVNDLETLPLAWSSPAIVSLRLGLMNAPEEEEVAPESAKRDHEDDHMEDMPMPAPIGHATFNYWKADHVSQADTIRVDEFYSAFPVPYSEDWQQDPNPLRPLNRDPSLDGGVLPNDPGLELYRWYNEGWNTDFWLDVDPDSDNREDWTFAVKQAVFDARVETFGYILATDLGAGLAAGEQPPAHSQVVYPMYQGSSNGGVDRIPHDVYFLILEADDEDFCMMFDCVYTPSFSLIPQSSDYLNPVTANAVGTASFANNNILNRRDSGTFAHERATNFVFNYDPSSVPTWSLTGGDKEYSPLKLVSWTYEDEEGAVQTKTVVANMPFVYWGSIDVQSTVLEDDDLNAAIRAEGTMLLVEQPGYTGPAGDSCDPLVPGVMYRPASYFEKEWLFYTPADGYDLFTLDELDAWWDPVTGGFFVPGPIGCDSEPEPSMRQRGGQLLALPDFYHMLAVFKTHRAAFDAEVVPFFSIHDSSDFWEALYHGVPWTPALNGLGRAGQQPYVSTFRQYGNGVEGEGVFGYQDVVLGTTPLSNSWTPFLQLSTLYWNCGEFLATTDVRGAWNQLEDGRCFATMYDYSLFVSPNPTLDLDFNCPSGTVIKGLTNFDLGLLYDSFDGCSLPTEFGCQLFDSESLVTSTVGWQSACLGQQSCSVTVDLSGAMFVGDFPTACIANGDDFFVRALPDCGDLPFEPFAVYDVIKDTALLFPEFEVDLASLFFANDLVPEFDVFTLAAGLKESSCPDYVLQYTGDSWARSSLVDVLEAEGKLFEFANPPGSELLSLDSSLSILNVHVPYVFRPAASFDPEDWVPTFSVDTVSAPVIQGVWALVWNRAADDQVVLAIRPAVNGAEPYMPSHGGLTADVPPFEDPANGCPSCSWEAVYIEGEIAGGDDLWYGQWDSEMAGKNVFRLDVPLPEDLFELAEDAIAFVLLECNDVEFAEKFSARYVANLPVEIATSGVWWNEPTPDPSGFFEDDVLAEALRSFTFAEVPSPILPVELEDGTWTEPNEAYTSFKIFSYENRWVVCNMPFIAWGEEAYNMMALDNGGCDEEIRADWGLPDDLIINGPPGCEDHDDPLAHFEGGQLLAVTEDTVAIKVHRAINEADGTFHFFSLWDSSNEVMANYYGIPVSDRLSWSLASDDVSYFANGIPCEMCNPYDFQDPILSADSTPVRAVTNFVWNCDDIFRGGDLFADSNRDGSACDDVSDAELADCDPYPLRAELKWVECESYVAEVNSDLVVFQSELTALIEGNNVFATYSPVGVPPEEDQAQEYINAPVLFTVDINLLE
jgi:hypothetical protein